MTFTDYLIDSALVLLVLLQIQERELTVRSMLRPLVIAGIAVISYLQGVPSAGNDLVLLAVLATAGLSRTARPALSLSLRRTGSLPAVAAMVCRGCESGRDCSGAC
jgi:hypothetical protein